MEYKVFRFSRRDKETGKDVFYVDMSISPKKDITIMGTEFPPDTPSDVKEQLLEDASNAIKKRLE